MKKAMRGIYAIPPTPFDENLELDLDSLKNLIDFCVASGCHGIVTPVNASEFTSLTDIERNKVVEISAKQNNGRLPFVAGISGVSSKSAVYFAKHAEACGADALIAMPPYINKATESQIFDYYQSISDAVNLPIFIQNYVPPIGTPLSARTLVNIVENIENVNYIKEETTFAGHVISEVIELSESGKCEKFKGIMGGKAGRYLLDEYRRGACGNMPACEVADIQAQIWNLLEAGNEIKATEMFNKVITLLNLEYLYGSTLYKAVLKYRGIIKHANKRQCGDVGLDAFDMVEFNHIMEYIKPMFTV